MSIRAYIIKRKKVESDKNDCDKFIVYRERTELFNVWKTTHLIDLFRWFGYDGSNEDCVGDFELTDEQFEMFMEDYEENTKNWTEYDLEVLEKIKKFFANGNWLLQLECF